MQILYYLQLLPNAASVETEAKNFTFIDIKKDLLVF